MTTEAVRGLATLLLYRNFLLKPSTDHRALRAPRARVAQIRYLSQLKIQRFLNRFEIRFHPLPLLAFLRKGFVFTCPKYSSVYLSIYLFIYLFI